MFAQLISECRHVLEGSHRHHEREDDEEKKKREREAFSKRWRERKAAKAAKKTASHQKHIATRARRKERHAARVKSLKTHANIAKKPAKKPPVIEKKLTRTQEIGHAKEIEKVRGGAETHRDFELGGREAIVTRAGKAQLHDPTGKVKAQRKIGRAELWKRARSK